MDVINISEIRKYLGRMQIDLEIVLHAIDTKVLVGEINRPEAPAEKKPRKKRTRKVKVVEPGIVIANILDSSLPDAEKTKRKRRTKKEMELEKEYQAGQQ